MLAQRVGGEGSLVVLLLAERARWECARSTRAVEAQSAPIPEEVENKPGMDNEPFCSLSPLRTVDLSTP